MQLLLQLEQEKGDKQKLDWLVSEGKKQVVQLAHLRWHSLQHVSAHALRWCAGRSGGAERGGNH
jgi:hypothetical protein